MTEAHSHHSHQSHPDIIKRLKRASGHLAGVVEMIEAGRPCLELAQQLHAVEKAIQKAKKALIQDHIEHCLEEVTGPMPQSQRQSLDDFKEITKYL